MSDEFTIDNKLVNKMLEQKHKNKKLKNPFIFDFNKLACL